MPRIPKFRYVIKIVIRSSLILATTFALLLGSLGLPVHLHACRMQTMGRSVASGCPMCEEAAKKVTTRACCAPKAKRLPSGPALRSGECCSDTNLHQLLDQAVMPRTVVNVSSLLVALLPVEALFIEPSITHDILGNCTDLPPPLPRHSQKSYLFNATFLI